MIRVYNADVFDGLKKMQEENVLVDCIITSPPYWGLRDYNIDGQIGLEEHPKDYVNKIVSVFTEAKKVLKDSGSLWLVLGDSYYSKSGSGMGSNFETQHKKHDGGRGILTKMHQKVRGKFNDGGWLQPKQRLLIPHRIAIGLQENGWVLRNDVVWHKVNHIPSSVQDRLTNSFEYVFLFVKSKKYFFNLDSIREPNKTNLIKKSSKKSFGNTTANRPLRIIKNNPLGKNPSDVWSLTSEPTKDIHFATFPTKLVKRCLIAGCPANGTVLDPFVGSGTVLWVCQELNLSGIGIELNPQYISVIKRRLFGSEKQEQLIKNFEVVGVE